MTEVQGDATTRIVGVSHKALMLRTDLLERRDSLLLLDVAVRLASWASGMFSVCTRAYWMMSSRGTLLLIIESKVCTLASSD